MRTGHVRLVAKEVPYHPTLARRAREQNMRTPGHKRRTGARDCSFDRPMKVKGRDHVFGSAGFRFCACGGGWCSA
jgi:hypothetical protein